MAYLRVAPSHLLDCTAVPRSWLKLGITESADFFSKYSKAVSELNLSQSMYISKIERNLYHKAIVIKTVVLA